MRRSALILLLLSLLVLAFRAEKTRPILPKHFPKPVYDFKKNPPSAEKILLGRALFYDPILSADSSVSCASCHSPFNAFAHVDHNLSHGIHDQIGTRNAPALFNLAWQKQLMWDGAINHLDMQALAPISHPKEMAEKIDHVVLKLNRSKLYQKLFFSAYNDSVVTGEHLLKALSQFQLTLVSAESKYDSVMVQKAQFTEQEQKGYLLFKQHCNVCHTEPLFTSLNFENNGLAVDPKLNDFGRWDITHQSADSLLFKVPTLRNLEYTYPYMHDGRFKKISQVLRHYSSGIEHGPTLSKALEQPMQMSPNDEVDIVAFLLTLSDRKFLFNPSYSFPKEVFFSSAKGSQ